jgi:hypothetical protein
VKIARAATVGTTVLLWVLGGGGCGGGGGLAGPCLDFLASAEPSRGTAVARLATGSNCDRAIVEIVLTDVPDVFAVEFTASFDEAVAAYEAYSLVGSALAMDGAQVLALEEREPGSVSLAFSRANPARGVDITGSRTLVRLVFRRVGPPGRGPLAFSSARIFGSEQPPAEKPGIAWFGGTFEVR